jgi:hypothetical protein
MWAPNFNPPPKLIGPRSCSRSKWLCGLWATPRPVKGFGGCYTASIPVVPPRMGTPHSNTFSDVRKCPIHTKDTCRLTETTRNDRYSNRRKTQSRKEVAGMLARASEMYRTNAGAWAKAAGVNGDDRLFVRVSIKFLSLTSTGSPTWHSIFHIPLRVASQYVMRVRQCPSHPKLPATLICIPRFRPLPLHSPSQLPTLVWMPTSWPHLALIHPKTRSDHLGFHGSVSRGWWLRMAPFVEPGFGLSRNRVSPISLSLSPPPSTSSILCLLCVG